LKSSGASWKVIDKGQEFPPDFANYKIRKDDNGWVHAISDDFLVTLIPETEKDRVFHTRTFQPFNPAGENRKSALIVELDGVKVFIKEKNIVVTKLRLDP
jgi:hypothetical protein